MSVTVRDLNIAIGGAPIVRGVDLDIADAQRVGLVGASGSGKSMISKAMLGLLPTHAVVSGSVVMGGMETVGTDDRRLADIRGRYAGMVFQNPAASLNPVMSVEKQVGLPLRLHYDLTAVERRERVRAMIRKVGLPDDVLGKFPHELSGGQQQRVGIATALITSPRFIIADEPTTALDSITQRQIVRLLVSLVDDMGASLLFITHDFRISQVAASPSMTEPSTSGSERKLDRPAVVLGARSICKSFGRRAAAHQVLFDVDVDVYEGECLAVIGGSGSGKSTLTRIMLGLENADGGTVEYRGTPVLHGGSGLRRLRHDSGLIYQDPYGSLDPRWTVGDIVAEPLSLRRRGSRPDPAGIRENVHAALERVGLDAGVFIDRYPMDLSGGQAQRVAIARAIITEPDVILADEPMSAIDVPARLQILETFAAIRQARPSTALIMVSHDLGVVQHIADRILVLHDGHVVEVGSTASILGDPKSEYTVRLIEAASL